MYEKWSEKHFNKGPILKSLYTKINKTFHNEFNQIVKTTPIWKVEEDKTDYENIMITIDKKKHPPEVKL